MIRLDVRIVRVFVAASAAWAAIACNAVLGIEEPPQRPAPGSDAEPNGDAGSPDLPIDASPEDAAMDTSGDGFALDALAPDAWPESGPSDDGPTDGANEASDVLGDASDPADAQDGDAGRRDGGDAGRPDGDAGRVDGDAPRVDAPRPDGPMPRPDGLVPPEISVVLTIAKDQDDATWINGTDERLHYDIDSLYLEVGADTEAGKAGLRFDLPVPPGSTINSAIIQLHRTIGDALADESMKVQVYDSANVPPFDDAHTHAPEGHAPGGLWPTVVGSIWVGENGNPVQTPELKGLVQHVVDRADWVGGASIGFVFSAQVMGVRWVDFADSSLGTGQAFLQLAYTPP
ncbi:MAG TPA: hypothetical protein VK550_05440 [Polyangiaceae bacterium]|nr:hypothetical protein [Polyangiaceae bacterium]